MFSHVVPAVPLTEILGVRTSCTVAPSSGAYRPLSVAHSPLILSLTRGSTRLSCPPRTWYRTDPSVLSLRSIESMD